MDNIREQLQIFVRRFGLLNASCCDECCGEQISMAQSHILFEIRRMGSPSIQRVADELGMDITTFSRQVKGLEAKGLILRNIAPHDRRVSLLELTVAGRGVLEKIDQYMAQRLGGVFGQMTSFERETVVRSLTLLNRILDSAGEAGRKGTVACCK